MEKKKMSKKKRNILIGVGVFVILALLVPKPTTYEAVTTYEIKGVTKGDETGYTKVLSNGDFLVGSDIEAGTYNVSGLGWADMITAANPLDMVTASDDGTVSNLELTQDQELTILDQGNDGLSASSIPEDITFTQVAPKTIEAETVNEKLISTDDVETCFINDAKSECSELTKYDELKADIDSQKV